MSFSPEIRGTGNFQENFGKLKRRVTKGEVPLDDLETMQMHVNNMRTQIDFARCNDIVDNVASIPDGPYDFIFEPDNTEVMMYNKFSKVYGDGLKLDKTLNSTAYDVIEIGDSSNILSTATASTYHYDPYRSYPSGKVGTDTGLTVVPHTSSLSLSADMSLACWFRTSKDYTSDQAGYIITKGNYLTETAGNNINYALLVSTDVDPNNVLEFLFETSTGVNKYNTASTFGRVNDGQWHHGVGTWNNTTKDSKVYVDGALSDTVNYPASAPDTGTHNLYIGGHEGFPTYAGDVDQVYIWNSVLTAGEVSALYSAGTVPQTSAIVYSNTFDGSGNGLAKKKCYYAVPDGQADWDWVIGTHPSVLKTGNAISLNVGTTGQFLYYDEFGTDFDFTANNVSFGFWIYLNSLPSTRGTNDLVMARRVDANNSIRIEIASADNKIFGEYKVAGTSSKRQYDTALVTNTWYYINCTCDFSGPTLSMKVNNNADTSSTKTIGSAPNDDKVYFGGFGNSSRSMYGYLAFPHWYKGRLFSTAERTSLYNYGTISDTTKPMIWGISNFG